MSDTRTPCAGTTKKGQSCKAHPLKGTERCLAHSDPETRASVGFVPEAGVLGGRPPKPRVIDVIRERIEGDVDAVLAPLFDGLQADRGLALMLKGGGMEVELITDHETRIKAALALLDRVYGRPRQATEVTGADGGPIRIEGDVDLARLSPEKLAALRDILKEAEA